MQARAKAQAPKESYSDPCPKEFGFPWTSYGAGKAGEANARPSSRRDTLRGSALDQVLADGGEC